MLLCHLIILLLISRPLALAVCFVSLSPFYLSVITRSILGSGSGTVKSRTREPCSRVGVAKGHRTAALGKLLDINVLKSDAQTQALGAGIRQAALEPPLSKANTRKLGVPAARVGHQKSPAGAGQGSVKPSTQLSMVGLLHNS